MKLLHALAALFFAAEAVSHSPRLVVVPPGTLLMVPVSIEKPLHLEVAFEAMELSHPSAAMTSRSVSADSARLTIKDGSGGTVSFTIS